MTCLVNDGDRQKKGQSRKAGGLAAKELALNSEYIPRTYAIQDEDDVRDTNCFPTTVLYDRNHLAQDLDTR